MFPWKLAFYDGKLCKNWCLFLKYVSHLYLENKITVRGVELCHCTQGGTKPGSLVVKLGPELLGNASSYSHFHLYICSCPSLWLSAYLVMLVDACKHNVYRLNISSCATEIHPGVTSVQASVLLAQILPPASHGGITNTWELLNLGQCDFFYFKLTHFFHIFQYLFFSSNTGIAAALTHCLSHFCVPM